jgi:hypothetical protein
MTLATGLADANNNSPMATNKSAGGTWRRHAEGVWTFCTIHETAEKETTCRRFRRKSQTYTPAAIGISKQNQSIEGWMNCIAIRV